METHDKIQFKQSGRRAALQICILTLFLFSNKALLLLKQALLPYLLKKKPNSNEGGEIEAASSGITLTHFSSCYHLLPFFSAFFFFPTIFVHVSTFSWDPGWPADKPPQRDFCVQDLAGKTQTHPKLLLLQQFLLTQTFPNHTTPFKPFRSFPTGILPLVLTELVS